MIFLFSHLSSYYFHLFYEDFFDFYIYHRTFSAFQTMIFSFFVFIIVHFSIFRRWFFSFYFYHRKNVGIWTMIFLFSTFIIVHNPFFRRGFLRFSHLSSSKYLIPYSYYFPIPTLLSFSHYKAYTHISSRNWREHCIIVRKWKKKLRE